MAQNITLMGASYPDVPAVTLPKTGGGTATFTDVSDSTAVAADVLNSKWFYTAQGIRTQGTATGGGGATQHVIHLEFDDSTDTDIDVYYDDALIGTMITAYAPSPWTYNNKMVVEAQLDGVTWYEYTPIPIGVELIDFTAVVNGYVVNDSTGEEEESQWSCCSDFTAIDPSMTFSYVGYQWYSICFYTSAQAFISSLWMATDDGTLDGDYRHGTLSGAKIPSNAAYLRISTNPTNPTASMMSLIRTA